MAPWLWRLRRASPARRRLWPGSARMAMLLRHLVMVYSPIISSIIPTVAALAAAIIGVFNSKRIQDVHLIVNSQRTQMLATIDGLKVELSELKQHLQRIRSADQS